MTGPEHNSLTLSQMEEAEPQVQQPMQAAHGQPKPSAAAAAWMAVFFPADWREVERLTGVATMAGHVPETVALIRRHGWHKRQPAVAGGRKPVYSHFMYGGLHGCGTLTVPVDRTRELATCVVNDFRSGQLMALTENAADGCCFRFYMDYDFETTDGPPGADLWAALQRIEHEEIQRFFPSSTLDSELFHSVVLSAGWREVKPRSSVSDGHAVLTKTVKTGVHVVYRHLTVTTYMALALANAIKVRALRELAASAAAAGLDWNKCIDLNVYGPVPHLRWAWQAKARRCDRCGGKNRATGAAGVGASASACGVCKNGFVLDASASMYAPACRVDGTGNVMHVYGRPVRVAPTAELLLDASIRHGATEEPSAGFVPYAGMSVVPDVVTKRPAAAAASHAAPTTQVVLPGKTGPPGSSSLPLSDRDPRMPLLLAACRRVNTVKYGQLEVFKASQAASGKAYYVQVFGTNSKFCMNMGDEHRNAAIKFVVTRAGAVQKCSCPCDEVRRTGKRCRDFESAPAQLLKREFDVLFASLSAAASTMAASAAAAASSASASTLPLSGAPAGCGADGARPCFTASSRREADDCATRRFLARVQSILPARLAAKPQDKQVTCATHAFINGVMASRSERSRSANVATHKRARLDTPPPADDGGAADV